MPKTYEKCGPDVQKIVKKIIGQYHPDLESFEVTVDCIFVAATDGDGQPAPALKKNGMQVAANIRKTSTEDRARGMADAKINIDRRVWDYLTPEQRDALIDHELTHLEITDGEEKYDNLGRPRLRLRPHDWEVTGFEEVVRRHKRSALEFKVAKEFRDQYGQLLMWAEDEKAVG